MSVEFKFASPKYVKQQTQNRCVNSMPLSQENKQYNMTDSTMVIIHYARKGIFF